MEEIYKYDLGFYKDEQYINILLHHSSGIWVSELYLMGINRNPRKKINIPKIRATQKLVHKEKILIP